MIPGCPGLVRLSRGIAGSHARPLLSRNLLYTAVTRAQKLCVLAGDPRALDRALANTEASDRHSRLVDRLLGA